MAINRRVAKWAFPYTLGYFLGRAIYAIAAARLHPKPPTQWDAPQVLERAGSVVFEGAVFLVTLYWLQSSGPRALLAKIKRLFRSGRSAD